DAAATANVVWPSASLDTAVKSLRGSKLRFSLSSALRICAELVVISKVWPSAAARAACCVPTMPPAPTLFSTVTVSSQRCDRPSASMRASVSNAPPGPAQVMMRTGCVGNFSAACALAGAAASKVAAVTAPSRVLVKVRTVVLLPPGGADGGDNVGNGSNETGSGSPGKGVRKGAGVTLPATDACCLCVAVPSG